MSEGTIVLVTGISGFLGAHIVSEALKAGYRVRGTVRSPKVDDIKSRYTAYGDKVDVIGIDDLANGDFTQALQGVDAVIHNASPQPRAIKSAQEALDGGIKGSLNIFTQAEKAGVRNFVYVSSSIACGKRAPGDERLITPEDWSSFTEEMALAPGANPFVIYCVQKTLSERAVWDFAERHPHIELTVLNPEAILGPFAPESSIRDGKIDSISTNFIIYDLIRPEGPPTPAGHMWIDVRDVARALVLSLRAPPTSQVGKKRLLIASDEPFNPKEVAEYVAAERPELKDRISKACLAFDQPIPKVNIDQSRIKEILNFEFTPLKKMIIDAVDSLVALEKEWRDSGIPVVPMSRLG